MDVEAGRLWYGSLSCSNKEAGVENRESVPYVGYLNSILIYSERLR